MSILTRAFVRTITLAATPQQLVTTSEPCAFVVLRPPHDADGVPANTKVAKVGTASAGCEMEILPTDGPRVVRVGNVQNLWCDIGANGEKLVVEVYVN